MRRSGLLITQIRRATDNQDTNAISNDEIVEYLNNAQDRIQSLIHQTLPETDIFGKEGFIDLVSNQEEYDLLSDIKDSGGNTLRDVFATNALASVERTTGEFYFPIKRISNAERRTGYGYILRDSKLLVAPFPTGNRTQGIRVVYARKLPDIDIRRGSVSASTSGVSVVLDVGCDTDLDTKADYFTVVDRDGVIKEENLLLDGFTNGTCTIATASTFTNISVGDYVVLGKRSTTHSNLPDVCERYLMDYAQRRLFMRDSSADIQNQDVFSSEEENDIVNLFANNISDAVYPPIESTDYLVY